MAALPRALVGRLPVYLRYLKALPPDAATYISATAIANDLRMGEVTVRKDLSAVGCEGKPKLGHRRVDLIAALEQALGGGYLHKAVIVGAGRLGRALMFYPGFAQHHVTIVSALDVNPSLWDGGGGVPVYPMERLEAVVREQGLRLGILTVPEGQAQAVCDRLIAAGIRAIWNFAPVRLKVPPHIYVHQEDMTASLAYLSTNLNRVVEREETEDLHESTQC